MFIIIKDNKLINKYKLDHNLIYKGIEIYYKNDNYYINLKDNYYFSDNTKSKVLKIDEYEIRIKDVYYSINLYVYENDKGLDDFRLYAKQKLLIACNAKANVVCLDKYLANNYLFLNDGFIKTNFDISVNGLNYDNNQLNEGDIIEYLGIKIIYFNDYLYINNFNIYNKLLVYNGHETTVNYPNISDIPNYYIVDKLVDLDIEEVDPFEAPKKNSLSEFIKSLVPNIVMSLSMLALALVSIYTSILNNQPEYSRITYILMPISMFITSIILPIGFYIYEASNYKKSYKATKDKYLLYLKEYEDRLENNINNYLNSYNSRYFDLNNFKDKMFYLNPDNDEFMQISIGKMVIKRQLTYKLSNDIDIDTYLNNISNRLAYINNFPLFVKLKENKIISIVCKNNNKRYFFNKFLLELSYKHHYDDLKIAVYSKDLSIFDSIFNLPHLFINKHRLTLNTDKGLQELNQIKLNKPLVLFIYDHIEFNFTNDNIYIIYLSNDISDIYKNSNCVIHYLNNNGYLYSDDKMEFSYVENHVDFNDYFAYLGRFLRNNSNNIIVHFKDIFSFNIKDNYLKHNSTLQCDFAYSNGELLSFDLHESKQGPHGLIGGSTGSGKSELIVSLLLSLCIRYAPDYLNIVLIDYKGGGLKESLSSDGICLEHVVASVSNLENNSLQRLIIALHNECKRRQELFKSLSRLANSSIMNLDDYLNNEYGKYGLTKLSHLLIVVDEFAELKKENPEQIKELISLSRIGRSLGLHLILATQKPSGVIDEEIWSNSHFKIALKVFEEKDSIDLIKRKDAAYLSNPGSFLLQVDDSLIEAQSIYSKNDINGNDCHKVSLLDNSLNVIKTYKHQNGSLISEASVFCDKITKTCEELNIHSEKIDFLPASSKYRYELCKEKCLVFGEGDDYINSLRGLIAYDIDENVLVYSTRFNEINSFLNTFNEYKRQCIVIANNRYEGAFISDSLLYDEQEDLEYLFDYLLNHKNLNLSLVIEDLNCLLSYNEHYLDKLCKLARRSKSLKLSLLFISTNSQISFKLINYFNKRILIDINDKSDVGAIYGCRYRYEGNSYYFNNEPISMVPLKLETYHSSLRQIEPIIKHIPEVIEAKKDNNRYLLGYDQNSKEEVYSDENIIIVSLDFSLLDKYAKAYNLKTFVYSHNFHTDINKDILWLGPGIFSQRLFISSRAMDLSQNEGIYISRGKKILIRSINNV